MLLIDFSCSSFSVCSVSGFNLARPDAINLEGLLFESNFCTNKFVSFEELISCSGGSAIGVGLGAAGKLIEKKRSKLFLKFSSKFQIKQLEN
jgi:hypothetical protein